MTTPEKETQLLIGKLVLEHSTLEKTIDGLRDELSRRAGIFAQIGKLLLFQPERLVFAGQTVGEQFAGETAIDRLATDVDSLIAVLRSAIVRKEACVAELAELGIDPEETERQRDLRASRAIFHPANTCHGPASVDTKRAIGFAKSRRKNES